MERTEFDVVVEIPRGSRNKYEMDKASGRIRLDRRLFSATVYPADYGYIDGTLGEDTDALDALVILDEPTFPGCLIAARPIGVFWMEDDMGPDAKIICVPAEDSRFEHMVDIDHLPEHMAFEIEHFFNVYKMLEPGKFSNTRGYEGVEQAWREVEASFERYKTEGGD